MREIQESGERKSRPKKTRPRRRGIAIILMAVSFLVVGGMIGLAIDVGIMYFLKARLSQAIDAASLAGARSLSRGVDLAAQSASAQATALNFYRANFPNNFWGCTVPAPAIVVTEDNAKTRYVTINATVTAPLYFLRLLGFSTTTLAASGQAARRDANIMIILDRSGSMSGAISQLVTSADWFVGNFAPGRDKVGLVTFGGTYNLIRPTISFSPSVVNAINTLNSGTVNGTTNHAQPLWVAYQALAEANEPGALNAIVFFTDGQPNTITADFQSKMKNVSTCSNGTGNSVIGYALTYSNGTTTGGLFGTGSPLPPYQPNSTSAGTVPTAYVSTAFDGNDSSSSKERISLSKNSTCNFYSDVTTVSSDLNGIPPTDYYGNSTNPATNRYKSVTLTTFNGTNLTNAAFNAGDQAAQRMRAGTLGTPTPIVPLIDTISLVTTGPIDDVYMKRLANTLDSPIYDSTKPTGLYKHAVTPSDLQGAFVQIASQILHLSL